MSYDEYADNDQNSKGLFQHNPAFIRGERFVADDSLPPNTFKIGDKFFEMKPVGEKPGVGERVRYIGTEFDTTHGGQVGTVMEVDGLAGLKWVQFDDDHVAPQGWFPAKDFESYVPTKFVEDPDMPIGGGVFYSPEQFPKRYDENVQGWFKERAGQWPIGKREDSTDHIFEQFAKLGGQGAYQLGKEMTEEMVGDVTERMREQFGANEPATEQDGILTCSCGSERWTTDVVIEHGSVTEYGSIRCAKCSRGRKGTFEIRRSDIEWYGLGDNDD